MKKMIAAAMLVILACVLCACNYNVIDTTWRFNEAQILMPDGSVVQGKVESWKDYEDGDQLQVKIEGVIYLTHATNVVLISE